MKLKKLLKGIQVKAIKGSKEIEITGITANSKLAIPGNLFIAKKGLTHDGSRFIPEAILGGAHAIVTDLYDPFLSGVTQVIHPDAAQIEAELAANYYQNPSKDLSVIGITGTNGKTTTSYMVKHLLDGAGLFCGLIGTVEYIVGKQHFPATLTTPDVITCQKLLSEIRASKYQAAVMEVSSHALDQNRVENIAFDYAIFTNLSEEHLDYHKNMESYSAAKAKLFSVKDLKGAILNADSSYFDFMCDASSAPVFSYGIEKAATLRASDIKLGLSGTQFNIHYEGETFPVKTPLIGRFNVYNALAAISVALLKGLSLEECSAAMKTFQNAPGRLELVPNKKGVKVFVDYAHTDDALKNVLEVLSEVKRKRLITVFGCGGNRDKAKRPRMAAVSEKYSDFSIVTTDNARQEDPEAICSQIEEGFTHKESYCIELDRTHAIQRAMKMAERGDIVLIAGKGHETYQMFASISVAFDDREVAAQSL